jgi:molybdopterin/thiamine biosynthesis adenylyltransferase
MSSMPTRAQKDQLRAALRREAAGRGRLTLRQATKAAERTGLPLAAVERFALEEGLVPERYERNLGTVGAEGQLKLLDSSAAVVGLGGLGGCVLESIARLGVGHILGFDPDRFAESNLNRQVLSEVGNLGSPKTEAAAKRVASINPAVEFSGRAVPFEQLDDRALGNCSAVFDCLDSIAARRALAEKCARAGVPLVHGAIAGWSGQVAVCPPGSDVVEKLYGRAERGAEERLGTPPFTAAVAANLMVSLAVPLLLDWPEAAREKVRFFDLRHQEWQSVEL